MTETRLDPPTDPALDPSELETAGAPIGSHRGDTRGDSHVDSRDAATRDALDGIRGDRPLDLVGQDIDGFQILEEMGRGAMGIVFRAKQRSLDREVAFKLLVRELLQDEGHRRRFLNEARATAQLTHPNIVQLYQVGQCIFGQYFAMALIEGKTLHDVLAKGPLPPRTLLSLMIRVAEAVDFAHSRGIVHRDLKPANILIDKSRQPIVMDFGLAKVLGDASITDQGIVGTPAFMAPEQTGETPHEVGPKTDIYALGATLYYALTGSPPFSEGSVLKTLWKVVSPERPRPVRELAPEVNEELERVVHRCLEKKPSDRYPSASTIAMELREIRDLVYGEGKPEHCVVTLVGSTSEKELPPGDTTLGRSDRCDIPLENSQVSKVHCKLSVGNEVTVTDLDSANGTFINGKRVESATLQDRDVLRVPGFKFVVRVVSKKK